LPACAVVRLAYFVRTQGPPGSTLFPYTTLFRSCRGVRGVQNFLHDAPGLAVRDRCLRTADTPREVPHLLREPVIPLLLEDGIRPDRKSTRLKSSHEWISYAVFCLKKKNRKKVIV